MNEIELKIKKYLTYDTKSPTGLVWKESICKRIKPGTIAGTKTTNGYFIVMIDRTRIMAHRVVWFLCTGSFPEKNLVIDHIDRNKKNNIIENLRQVTQSENCRNTKNRRQGIPKNIYFCPLSKKWKVYLKINNQSKYIGQHFDKEFAELIAFEARQKFYYSK